MERPVRFESLSGLPLKPVYTPADLTGWRYDDLDVISVFVDAHDAQRVARARPRARRQDERLLVGIVDGREPDLDAGIVALEHLEQLRSGARRVDGQMRELEPADLRGQIFIGKRSLGGAAAGE